MIESASKNIMRWTRLGMRKSFGDMIGMIAENNENIIVMAADVASSAKLQDFKKKYPKQFFNLGIAEQNMLGVAAGLSKEGYNVFVVSFAPFISMRAYEAIRTLVGYMNLNVKVVALASGLSLGVQGNTHYSLEDMSLMRTIPNIQIFSPADCMEEVKCLQYLSIHKGPAYIRLTGIDGSPCVYREDFDFQVGCPNLLREGKDILCLSTGSITSECVRLARALKKDALTCTIYDISTIKPMNFDFLQGTLLQYRLIMTVEEHFRVGGLGGIVAEYLSEQKTHPPLLRIGVQDEFPHADVYANLLDINGLTVIHMRQAILKILERGDLK